MIFSIVFCCCSFSDSSSNFSVLFSFHSDLICSRNSPNCFITHTQCIKNNDSNEIFSNFVIGKHCFLCKNCVDKSEFSHPTGYKCIFESSTGNFYETSPPAETLSKLNDQQLKEARKQSSNKEIENGLKKETKETGKSGPKKKG